MATIQTCAQAVAKVIKDFIIKGSPIRIISHYDADGLTSAGILGKALMRAGARFHFSIVEQLEKEHIESFAHGKYELFVFTDLGSGQLDIIQEKILPKANVVVIDHHRPLDINHERLAHINPHFFGFDGSKEASGSSMSYLCATALDSANKDLADLAIVGAVGDRQDSSGALLGLNAQVLKEGEEANAVKAEKDLRLFGRHTHPLHLALSYTIEPYIPEITGNESKCVQFLTDLKILSADKWNRRLIDLNQEEKQRLITSLILKMIEGGSPSELAEGIIGEVYTLLKEEENSELRDAKSFATLLNACGRNHSPSVGLAICLGDRTDVVVEAKKTLKNHRMRLSKSLNWVYQNSEAIHKLQYVQYFHGENHIEENLVGTVTSMAMSSKILNSYKPVVAFAFREDKKVKVSARATRKLVEKGLNLAEALHSAAHAVGGIGGGHDVAAGATIPIGSENQFIKLVEESIKNQMSGHGSS
ncbi:MAG: DHH family phosphoesterase [Euryarchaeota archaeon]|nr:DHH family phosphoesterase [Euryarchaeota archaeon]